MKRGSHVSNSHMNWIVGTHYKTRGGQIVEIISVTHLGIDVKFADGTITRLNKSGMQPDARRDWDLVQLVGPTQHG